MDADRIKLVVRASCHDDVLLTLQNPQQAGEDRCCKVCVQMLQGVCTDATRCVYRCYKVCVQMCVCTDAARCVYRRCKVCVQM